ncbi:hypothetical protein KSP40_PGU008651 [Platanthera guangdongensis]|uniref:Protein BZR1 homolog n=1 Tax=Platanthera guangdongensis TaxID=2320717 RepID=A0ABR2LEP5_9ASPA
MTSGTRLSTWKERENNKRRERRRRAIAAKIYAGLRMYGNYKLPKHCDNNEVLKALCNEAGWTVEPDGTTYRKGCMPPERMDSVGCSTPSSPHSSYHPSPGTSSFPGPAADVNCLIPWLKNLSSSTSSSASSSKSHSLHNLCINHSSTSAPVTPPSGSPTARTPCLKTVRNSPANALQPSWTAAPPSSALPCPNWKASVDPAWPMSPTFSLVMSNPFGGLFQERTPSVGSSRFWTPGQSGMCSPVLPSDAQMLDDASDEFAFGSCGDEQQPGVVKPWEGERIHEDCGSDELDLTLGSSRTRAN